MSSVQTSNGAGPKLVMQARGLVKKYGQVTALDGSDFELRAGEILAVIGDNGAGKSSLIKALSGATVPDSGEIFLDGAPAKFRSPIDARRAGIETVYQDLALADDLSAPANLFLGRERRRPGLLGRLGVLDNKRMQTEAEDYLRTLGARVPDYQAPVRMFSGGQRQTVAIARAGIWARELVIMDEPTAALGLVQTEQVAQLIKRTRDRGIAVIVISHSVPFVTDVADRIVVLRLGSTAATLSPATTSHDEIVAAITGAATGTPTDRQGSTP
jgi:ABC-type sugar transport system ATPase subunit